MDMAGTRVNFASSLLIDTITGIVSVPIISLLTDSVSDISISSFNSSSTLAAFSALFRRSSMAVDTARGRKSLPL